MVNRLVAGPNSKAYGRLSVMAQYYCQVIPVLEVPPSAFTPPPKVDSAVVRLVPHATMPYPVKDIRVLSRITTGPLTSAVKRSVTVSATFLALRR